MVNRNIYFYEETETIEIDCSIPMACTNKFFSRCEQYRINADSLLTHLSRQQVLLIRQAKYKDQFEDGHLLTILTERGILLCSLKSDGQILILDLFEKNIREQNKYLKQSLKLYTSEKITISHINSLTDRVDVWGGNENELSIQASIFKRFVSAIRARVEGLEGDKSEGKSTTAEEPEESLSKELEELLDIAENYVIAEDEIQRANAQSGPIISYYSFDANSNAAREEKVSYVFTAFDYDQQLYKKGTRVEVELVDGKVIPGAIVESNEENEDVENSKITILFDDIFSIHELPHSGIIKLEYNSVQRNVREAVISDLREFDSLATYFDPLIGNNQSSGFENQELSQLNQELDKQKYPPNDSQKDAIFRGINVRDGLLVLGPPGTGKTTVILQWVKYFVEQENKRVLISSQNNKAVDNVLERLSNEKTIDTIRVGNEDKVQANVQHLTFESRSYELQQRITLSTTDFQNSIVESERSLSDYKKHLINLKELVNLLKEINIALIREYDAIQVEHIEPVTSLYKEYLTVSAQVLKLQDELEEKSKLVWAHNETQGMKSLVTWPQKKWNQMRIKQLYKQWETLSNQEENIISDYEAKVEYLDTLLNNEQFIQWKKQKVTIEQNWNELKPALYTTILLPLRHLTLPELTETNDFNVNVKDLETSLDTVEDRLEKLSVIKRSLNRWTGYLQDKKNYALSKILLESVDLVGATCIGINSNQRFQDVEFDVTIIDEAGQIKIQDAIVPMSRSPKFIMLGDHKQIPPIEDQEVIERVEEIGVDTSFQSKSFFEYLYDRFPDENKILLDTQYRMPDDIANILSEWFYDGKYKTFIGKQEASSPLPYLFSKPLAIIDTSKEYHRLETNVPGQGYYNEYEAKTVVQLLTKILKDVNPEDDEHTRYSYEDIGIITPYGKQVQYIRDLVAKEFPMLTKKEICQMVASLDSFQGQERPIVIYSCTRSNLKPADRPRIGFLKELRRLNVALSRCQDQLIFIGDMNFLSSCQFTKDNANEKEFSAFIQLMLTHVENEKGQIIESSSLFKERGKDIG